ncbi:conserved exported hypothetical protein [Nitrolancea hollandica Lb]|uniref:Uncharacterized protein n=2 Tax=Nitrolancea hollandica TaxID=1206749 RepID=I4EMY5_9BACT|nr:conserved exported hypothetical protein [Nitrolancea hollandica Lb]
MFNRVRRATIACFLVLCMTAGTVPWVGAAEESTPLSAAAGVHTAPRTDGHYVVWIAGQSPSDVYAANLSDRRPFPVATGPADQTLPDIDGGIAVWAASSDECPTCQRDIRGKDLATGREFDVVSTPADESLPAISGNWVVWVTTEDGVQLLQARDIHADAEPLVLASLKTEPAGRPAIDGDRVVWGEQATGQDKVARWRLLTRKIGAGDPMVIAEGNGSAGLVGYDVAGDTVVYAADGNLNAYSIVSGKTRTLASAAQFPTTDGRYVFWEDHRFFAQTEGQRVDLSGYDLSTDSAFGVSVNQGRNGSPDTKARTLTWQRGRDSEIAVYAATITDTLPSTRRPDPGATSPNWFYFSETGHYLSFGFKHFWEQSGGLPVFGFPLTEEFDELNPGLGKLLSVQYLERQRYEYHPEHAGTPYETELGLLGTEDAQQRKLLGTQAFQPLPASTNIDANCIFMPETGHRLCGGFKAYWQSHGLEFGDPGMSYRESLALFGYPISEEFTDPSTGLVTQYFERARFEYHPEKPDPYKVLLGRLGADRIAERGWEQGVFGPHP